MRRAGALVAAGVLALLVGCSSQPQGDNIDPDQVDAVDPPTLGACRMLTPEDVALPANATEVVECSERHTAETYYVAELPADFDEVDYDDPELAKHGYEVCTKQFGQFIGADASLVLRTTLSWALFRPSEEAWDKGARWLRCDVVGSTGEDSYVPLPKSAKGILAGRPEDRWLACAVGPRFDDAKKVPCSEKHDWRAVATVKLGEPDDPYPGDRVSASRTDSFCAKQVEAWLGYPAEWNFGITSFHKAEWELGNRRSICWAQTPQ